MPALESDSGKRFRLAVDSESPAREEEFESEKGVRHPSNANHLMGALKASVRTPSPPKSRHPSALG